MKKKVAALLLFAAWMACLAIAPALGADFGTALVDGQSTDRVHLRERPSVNSKSYGLYFTGTEVQCLTDPNQEWVRVTIGSQAGYMKSEFLHREPGSVSPQQPTAMVNTNNANSWVNLRSKPSLGAAVAGQFYHGDTVTVLGETVTKWYYVRAGDVYGYMMSSYLLIGGSASPNAPSPRDPSAQGYEMLLYTHAPNHNSSIRIEYPRFTSVGLDSLNALIYAKVQGFAQLDPSLFPDSSGLTIDYRSAVTLQNSKIASVIFWGSSYVEGSIHPFTDLIAVNVDLSSMREIALQDLYTIDAGFEKVFFDRAFFPTNPVTSYDAASFSEMLQSQSAEHQIFSPFSTPDSLSFFLKPDGIVLSMPAIHATGSDHFEAQLRYRDIQRFYRLRQNYWED